jgi:hypothetical protein
MMRPEFKLSQPRREVKQKARHPKNNGPPKLLLRRAAVICTVKETASILRGCSAVAISHRNRSSVRPGHRSSARKPEHSRWAHSSSSCSSRDGGTDGNGDGSTWERSTRARHSTRVPEHSRSVPERSRWARKPEHSSSSCSSDGGTDGNGDACTSAHSTRAQHSTTVPEHSSSVPGRSTTARGHNTKAHNSRQTGGLPPARRKARTGRRAAGPATRSGISSTELLNRYLQGMSHLP